MAKFIFITGTDTGVGKTRVACALIHAARSRGIRVAGFKPVAAGCEQVDGEWVNEDALVGRASRMLSCNAHTKMSHACRAVTHAPSRAGL